MTPPQQDPSRVFMWLLVVILLVVLLVLVFSVLDVNID